MIKTCKLAGITFRIKDRPTIGDLRPQIGDELTLEADRDNKFDRFAVKVFWENNFIGFVPKGVNEWVHNCNDSDSTLSAYVKSVGYLDGESWNNDEKGIFQAMEFDIHGKEAKGWDYLHASSIGDIMPGGNVDPLIQWCYKNYKTYDEYKEGLNGYAEAGTELHDKIEEYLEALRWYQNDKSVPPTDTMDGFIEKLKELPKNARGFFDKLGCKVLSLEEKVIDHDLQIQGRYDAFLEVNGHKILFDWKSSKAVQKKHKYQVAWYAKQVGAKYGAVVAFGAQNKQQYSVCVFEVDKYYEQIAHHRRASLVELPANTTLKKLIN